MVSNVIPNNASVLPLSPAEKIQTAGTVLCNEDRSFTIISPFS